ncbi:hypothetical protein PLESTB_001038400 [Pleodorina starrii]|uniref:Uncharacterized protein n=1 Tax=Pleodorina starrii TaxID=330485 RepID=A0A9W6F469_9CHLO|nr:hypothetical protein PLESTB_001038400 [Pleodorina starrii]
MGWACILLHTLPNATTDIRNSIFINNVVNDSGPPPSLPSPPYPPSQPDNSANGLPLSMLRCTDDINDQEYYEEPIHNAALPGYGAVLVASYLEGDDCTTAGDSFVRLEGTTMNNNTGGAKFVGMDAILHITGASILHNNCAGSNGGAVCVRTTVGNITSILLNGNSTVSANTAGENGGGIYIANDNGGIHELHLTGGSNVSANTAGENGGGIYVANANGGIHELNLTGGSSLTGNLAANGNGGAAYLTAVSSGYIGPIYIVDADVFNNSAMCNSSLLDGCGNGGGMYISAMPGTGSHPMFEVRAEGRAMLTYNTARRHGGAMYIVCEGQQQARVSPGFSLHGATFTRNRAQTGSGGAVYLRQPKANLDQMLVSNTSFIENEAACRGGAISVNTKGPEDGIIGSVTITNGSVFASNGARKGETCAENTFDNRANTTPSPSANDTPSPSCLSHGGAIYFDVNQLGLVTIEAGSSMVNNSAEGDGGAIAVAEMTPAAGLQITGGSNVSHNDAACRGGFLFLKAGVWSNGTVVFRVEAGSIAANNSAGSGILDAWTDDGNISDISVTDRSRLENNKAGGDGGAMAAVAADLVRALKWNGTSTLSNNTADGKGGGLSVSAKSVQVVMEGGCSWDNNTARSDGGALLIDDLSDAAASSVVIAGGSKLRGNRASNGGAVYINGFANFTVSEGSNISFNSAEYDGGAAVFTQLPPSFHLESCFVLGNSAARGSGGAFYLSTVVPWTSKKAADGCLLCALSPSSIVRLDITNASVADNSARAANGGAFYVKPHETCCYGTNISFGVFESQFNGNKAMGAGGAIAMYDASNATATVSINGSKFSNNTAGIVSGDFKNIVNFGGAITIWREQADSAGNLTKLCQLSAANTSFEANECNGGSGGAVTLIACSAKFIRCNFTANRATLSGGAIAALHVPRTTATLGLTSSGFLDSSPAGGGSTGQSQSGLGRRRVLSRTAAPTARQPQTWPAWESVSDSSRPDGSRLAPSAARRKLWDSFPWDDFGSGCAASRHWSVSLLDCNFLSNYAALEFGGALYLYASSDRGHVHIDRNNFTENKALSQHAGAVFLAARGECTSVQLTNSVFDGNAASAASAGALYVLLGMRACGELTNVSLSRNSAATSGGACVLDIRSNGALVVDNVTAVKNSALAGDGGALKLQVQTGSAALLRGCGFNDNKAAGNGGAALLDGNCRSYLSLQNTRMARNWAGLSGGGLYASYAARTAPTKGGSAIGSSRAAVYSAAAPCPPDDAPDASGEWQHMSVQLADFRDNEAGQQGGAIFVAPASTVTLTNATMDNNTACAGGGSLAAQSCSALALRHSTLHNSATTGSGGGFYASGCRRILFEFVDVAGNEAACSGGGLLVTGGEVTSIGGSSSTAFDFVNYTSALLHRVRLTGNAAGSKSGRADGSCGADKAPRQQTWRAGAGGGLFINGSVVAVLSRSNLTEQNDALFGHQIATAQRCYPRNASDSPSAGNKDLPIWVEDFLASALHARCSSEYQFQAQFDNEATNDAAFSRIRNTVRDRLVETRGRVLSSTNFLVGQTLSYVSNGAIIASADVMEPLKAQRVVKDFANQLDDCVLRPASFNLIDVNDLLRNSSYIGLPDMYIGLVAFENPDVAGRPVHLQLQTGASFNLIAQLYNTLQQKLNSDIGPSTVTLALRPRPLDDGPYNAAAADGSVPWLYKDIANLDPGLNRSLTVPVINGSATWSGVKAYAWPGIYSLVLSTYVESSIKITVGGADHGDGALAGNDSGGGGSGSGDIAARSLQRFLTKMNDTLKASDDSCKTCPSNALCLGGAVIVPEQGYWHSAANSTQIHSCPNPSACSSPKDDGPREFPRWLDERMGTQWDRRTKLLAWCQLTWYSSVVPGADITAAYYNAYPPVSNASEVAEVDSNATALADLLNRDASLWGKQTASEAEFKCLVFGLAPGHPDSYMQQLCLEGYTGNLCASCVAGYYVDSDFNCKRCPELARTITLGLISFFSSVILVLITTMTNLTEGFGEKKAKQQQQQQVQVQQAQTREARDPVELGDVVKVIVLHVQYLIIVTRLSVDYPSIIVRCQAVFSTITGAENYLVYSPSCLKPESDSGGQALIQWLAGILTPCAVAVVSMLLWTLRYGYPLRKVAGEALGNGLLSAWAAMRGACRAAATWREGRHLQNSRSDVQSVCGSEGSAVVLSSSKHLVAHDPTSMPSPLTISGGGPVLQGTTSLPSPEAQEGGIGVCTVFSRDAHVVAFDGADAIGTPAEAAAPIAGATAMVSLATPASPTDPTEAAPPQAPVLPTAASAALVVDLDGVVGVVGGQGGYGGGPAQQVAYYRHPYSKAWHRKTPHRRSTAISKAAFKTLHKLRTLAVSTQQSSQATFHQVDKAMSLREQLGVVLMAAVFILYPSWANAALSTFACYPIDDGKGPFPQGQQATWRHGYWVRDMQTQCYSGTHLHVYVPIGVAAVLVFCLLPPLASFMFVWRVRNRLEDTHVRKVYGFLYKRYKPRYIWWETALQLETLVLVTVEVLGRGLNVSYQALLLLAFFIFISLFNVSCAPLVSQLLVIMEYMSLGTLSLTITLSLYFTVDDGLSPAAQNTLAILIITLNVCLLVYFLYVASRHFWPSAVKKVATKAQAVLRKLSSIGSSAGNNHSHNPQQHLRKPPHAADSVSNEGGGSRFCWPLLGRFAVWRGNDAATGSSEVGGCRAESTSSETLDAAGRHVLERSSDEFSDSLSGPADSDSVQLAFAGSKGLDIARASVCLDDRLSSYSMEMASRVADYLKPNTSHVCIQLEEGNGSGGNGAGGGFYPRI